MTFILGKVLFGGHKKLREDNCFFVLIFNDRGKVFGKGISSLNRHGILTLKSHGILSLKKHSPFLDIECVCFL